MHLPRLVSALALVVVGPLVVALVPMPAAARGERAPSRQGPQPPPEIEVEHQHLVVFTDGKGHYVATRPTSGTSFAARPEPGELYYSADGKTFRQQRVGSHLAGGKSRGVRTVDFWEPRVDDAKSVGTFEYRPGSGELRCSASVRRAYTEVPKADRQKMLEGAVFFAPSWAYEPHALARDDQGTYYYVDREIASPRAFRFWRGPRGAMKAMQMTNVVSDSRGDIFATRSGQLRLVIDKGAKEPSPIWLKGKTRTALTWVPVDDNQPLIFRELGIYEGSLLGTPCDDV